MSTSRRLAEDDTLVPNDRATVEPDPRSIAETRELSRGTVVSRYVILERIGSGGMGVVYAAYDPQLDRRIAVKVLSAERSMDTQGRQRMLREAQAMARLTHPNVVAVHDVGVHAGRTFIAMEYIEGQTIKAWLAAGPRTWREVLRVYTAAARGLVAAHAVELVHRDFKPDNVMLAPENPRMTSTAHGTGRVLVMDFGLARPLRSVEADAAATTVGEVGITQTGSFAGTPAYMAPEQFAGATVGPKSDQFSFCIALYEGLFGERPFLGDTVSALAASVTLGKTQPQGMRSGVPWHLRQAVLRGLAADPAQRHASMADLLAILERDPSRTRRNVVAFGVAVCTLAGSFAVGSLFDPETRRCERGAAAIDAVWSAERRARVGEAFSAAQIPQAEQRWAEIAPLFDAHAERWRAAFEEACAATHVRGEQSDARLDARMLCLQDRRERLDALLGELESVDLDLAARAAAAAHALPAVEGCSELAEGESLARSQESKRALDADRLAAAERALAVAKARNDAGRYAQGIAATQDALAELGDDDVPWLKGEILVTRAELQKRAGETVAAEQTARDALRAAAPAGHHEIAARAWTELMFIVGVELARPGEALALRLAAELELDAIGQSPTQRRKFEGVLAALYQADAQYDLALEHHEAAIALAQIGEAPPLARASIYGNYGNTLYDLGRFRDAFEAHERAYDLSVATLGAQHPSAASDMMNLGRDLERLGETARSRELYLRALGVREAALGPSARGVAEVLLNLAVLEYGQLEFGPAREHGVRALDIFRNALGPDHPHVAAAYNNLGNIAHAEGDLDEAMRDFDEVARIYEARFGADYPKLAIAHKNRGNVLLERGDFAAALELYDRAMEIDLARLGPDHPSLAFEYLGKVRALLALDRADEAVPLAERAVALREGVNSDAGELTVGYFALAQALWSARSATAEMKQRALAYGRRALVVWRNTGIDDPNRLAQYETWLRERGGNTGIVEG